MSSNLHEFFIWPTTFSCSLVIDDVILPVNYNLTVGIMPDPGVPVSATGLTKIKKFVTKFVQNSVIVKTDHLILPTLLTLSNNTIQLPQEPHDYFFSNILYRKLSTIANDYFVIRQLTVDSTVGDHVKYQINEPCTAYENVFKNDGWWNRDDVSTNDTHFFPSWEDLDIHSTNKFSAKIIKGGKSGIKSV